MTDTYPARDGKLMTQDPGKVRVIRSGKILGQGTGQPCE